ncbi:MAG: hypothetical protein HZB42_14285 [Sphingobacteriales bacterium]|nr:hypothetical protein [Sphingobacteriales bacterium]
MALNLRLKVYLFFLMALPCIALGQNNHLPPIVPADDSMQVKEWLKQCELIQAKNPGEASQLAKKALALSNKLQYEKGLAASNMILGNIHFQRKEYMTALSNYENAKSLLISLNDEYQLGRVYKSIGEIYLIRILYRQASDNFREATVLLRKTGQLKLLNECQDALGNIAMDNDRTNGAIIHFKRSLIIKNGLNDISGLVTTNTKLSKLYFSQKQYDSAMYYTKEAQRLSKESADAHTDAVIDEFIILSSQGKLKEAAEIKKVAEQSEAVHNNSSIKIKLLTATSNYYMALKDKEMAGKYFDSAAAMISDAKSPELAIFGLSLLEEMSSRNEDFKTAYRMMKLMDMYKDMFRTENMERIAAELKNTTEAGLKEKEIEYLNLLNKLKEEQLSKEELKRMALLRENILKDSSLSKQELLMAALETESDLRNKQLQKEKELSYSLGRENELKQQLLNDERKNKKLLWIGIGAMGLLGGIIFYQYNRQRKKNRIINKQSGELEVLNKEIHHRVKNNLQVISSMLDLQSQSLHDEKATAIIKEGIQRVQSMAFIHQNLYQGNAVNSVNMNEYIKMLSNHLFQSYNIQPEKIHLHTQIEDFNLHTDTAIPLGMILNELISNSLKYAFRGKDKGDIWVTMKRSNSELLLQVKDNGVGLPDDFNMQSSVSFGYEIINAFAQKLKARINIESNNGTDVQLIISKFKTV